MSIFDDMFKDLDKGIDTASKVSTSLIKGLPDWMRKREANNLRREMADQGFDAATIEACASAVMEGRPFDHFIARFKENQAKIAATKELLENPPPDHGSARWSMPQDLQAAGLLKPLQPDSWQDGSLFLGVPAADLPDLDTIHPEQPIAPSRGIFWNGRQHLLTVAPMRTGKSFTQIVSNLLAYPGAAIVLDPKGELFQATSKWRQNNVGPVYVLNPFGLSTVPHTDCFDPLSRVRNDLARADQHALALAHMLIPDRPREQGFFAREVRALFAGIIETYARYFPDRSIWDMMDLMTSHQNPDFIELLENMRLDENLSISAPADEFLTRKADNRGRFFESFSADIAPWRNTGIKTVAYDTEFRFEDLKDQPITVYLALPFDQLQTHSTYVTTMLSLALDALTVDDRRANPPVLMILDELLAIDPFPKLVESLRRLPSYGIRVWSFLQNISDLQAKYPDTWKSFFDCEAEIYFGLSNQDTVERLSDQLGETTISRHSSTEAASADHYSINDSVVLKGRRLMTPDELRNFLTYEHPRLLRYGVQVINKVQGSGAQTVMVPWREIPFLAERIGSVADEEPVDAHPPPLPDGNAGTSI